MSYINCIVYTLFSWDTIRHMWLVGAQYIEIYPVLTLPGLVPNNSAWRPYDMVGKSKVLVEDEAKGVVL